MCVLRCFSQQPENICRRTSVSHKICLRWSWKIKLSENINFDSFRMCVLRCFSHQPENLYKRTSVPYKICLRWFWKIVSKYQFQVISNVRIEIFVSAPSKPIQTDSRLISSTLEVILENQAVCKISISSQFECACWDVFLNTLKTYTGGHPSHIKYAWGDPGN